MLPTFVSFRVALARIEHVGFTVCTEITDGLNRNRKPTGVQTAESYALAIAKYLTYDDVVQAESSARRLLEFVSCLGVRHTEAVANLFAFRFTCLRRLKCQLSRRCFPSMRSAHSHKAHALCETSRRMWGVYKRVLAVCIL